MQKDNINEIDRLLREKFDDFGSDPSPELWNNIAKKIVQDKPKKDKPPFSWFYLCSILLISGACVTVLLFYNNGDTINSKPLVVNNSAQKNVNQNPGIDKQNVGNQNAIISNDEIDMSNNSEAGNNNTPKSSLNKQDNNNTQALPSFIKKETNTNRTKNLKPRTPVKKTDLNSKTTANKKPLVKTNNIKKGSPDPFSKNQKKQASPNHPSGNSSAVTSASGNKQKNKKIPADTSAVQGPKLSNANTRIGTSDSSNSNLTKKDNPDHIKANQTGQYNNQSARGNTVSNSDSSNIAGRNNLKDTAQQTAINTPPNNNTRDSLGHNPAAILSVSDSLVDSSHPSKDTMLNNSLVQDKAKDSTTASIKDSIGVKQDSSQAKKSRKDLSEKFALSLAVSPLMMLNNNDPSYHGRLSYQISMGLDYRISSKLSLMAGLSILNVRNKLISSFEYIRYDTSYAPNDSLHANPLIDTTTIKHSVQADNHYSYFGVPVTIRYQGGGDKLFFSFSLGINPMFITGIKETYVTEKGSFNSEKTEFNSFTMSAITQLGINYRISPKIVIFVEPGLRYFMKNVHKHQNFGISKPLLLGIETGIRIIL
jgi:hypothetical protein